ncbi:MAG: transposase [Patescibacteria group bacterium]
MNRKIIFTPENYYHIFDRGTEKRDIFLNESNYQRFLILLYLCNGNNPVVVKQYLYQISQGRTLEQIDRGKIMVDIGAYCLMPNHFHLLIKEKTENGIPNFMKKLNTGYAMYFNKKNERSGSLFQGKFGAQLLDKDGYLKYIFAYIHLNPIKLIEPKWKESGIKDFNTTKDFLNNYPWSSYLYFIGNKKNDPILNISEFPEYFKNTKEFNNFIGDWLKYRVE